MKYYLTTYGCQANERDTELIAGILEDQEYELAENMEDADLIIFNTCCVRDKAENKVFSQVGSLKELKSRKPHVIIAICGCMVQQDKMPERIRRTLPHVDFLFGTHNIHELPALLKKVQANRSWEVSIYPDREVLAEDLPSRRTYPFKGLVHITYGCNNFCTYCIVPYVRGREKSRQPVHIISEIKQMASEGVMEVMLLGQNVNSYGKDLPEMMDFADLLLKVNNITGLRRIRYMTSHPRDFSDKLVNSIASAEKVCKHFHLPVQAGSDKILQSMNRGYTRDYYLKLIAKIRCVFPTASITTDIIVGFPGETEEDFLATLDLVERVRFDSAFTFIYSPRTGTPAAAMKDQIAYPEKKERLQRLMAVQNKISLELNKEMKGKVVEVLVEGSSKTTQKMLTGRTETNKTVLFPGPDYLTGRFVKVEITHPQTWVLKGKMV